MTSVNLQNLKSVVAESKFPKMSDRYGFVPTLDVVDALSAENWLPVSASERQSRSLERIGYQTHMIRFQNPNIEIINGVDKLTPEIVLFGSHDGSSAIQLMAGLFRFLCANGLICANEMFGKFKIRHSINARDYTMQAVEGIVESLPAITNQVHQFQDITLSLPEYN
jgi:hypothetical protein